MAKEVADKFFIATRQDQLRTAPFAFNIGIDSKLMQLINTGRSLSSTDWLANIKATEESTDEAEQ